MVEPASYVDLEKLIDGKKFISEAMLSFEPKDVDIFIRGNTAEDY